MSTGGGLSDDAREDAIGHQTKLNSDGKDLVIVSSFMAGSERQ